MEKVTLSSSLSQGNKENEKQSSSSWGNYIIGAGLVTAAVAVAPIAIGFGSAGVVGGSIAAGIQAGIGNVVAGSVFSTMTSLGMTGVFTTATVVGAGTVAAGVGVKVIESNGKENPKWKYKLVIMLL